MNSFYSGAVGDNNIFDNNVLINYKTNGITSYPIRTSELKILSRQFSYTFLMGSVD